MNLPARPCRKGLHEIPAGERFCNPCKNDRRRERRRGQSVSDLIECPVCHQHFEVLRVEHARLHGFDTLEDFKDHFGLEHCVAESRRTSISEFHTGRKQNKRSNGQKGLKRTPASRAKMSAAATARCLANKGPLFAGIQGEWVLSFKADQQVYVRSSWERRVLAVLDHYDEIEEVEVEPFAIPYTFEGVEKQYIPDLLITFEGGVRELWEIKPLRFCDTPQNQAKFKALRSYAMTKGMNSRIVTLEAIERMERKTALMFAMRPF